MPDSAPALAVRGLSKVFPSGPALTDVSLSIRAGETRVLLGANGSGKSTLIKTLSGFHLPEPGSEAEVGGVSLEFGSPASSYALGCRFVHQDLGLIDNLSVWDNLHIGQYPARCGTIRSRAARRAAAEMLDSVGLAVAPTAPVSSLGPVQRTGVALARALRSDAQHPLRLLVLDEPTAALPPGDVDHLLEMVRAVTRRGVAVLFVTHHLAEVEKVGHSVTVLRDGVIAGEGKVADLDRAALVHLVVGEAVEPGTHTHASTTAEVRLSVSKLSGPSLYSVSFQARRGEVLGFAGLTGSGQERLLGAMFGAVDGYAGEIAVDGRLVDNGRPDRSVAAGISYLPADRKALGGLMELSAQENLTLPLLKPFWRAGWLSARRERQETRDWFERFDVRPAGGAKLPLKNFSGGNQQKVLLAKWMRTQPDVLLLDEPTQGVDVGAKVQIHRTILAAAEGGMTVLISSTDFEELGDVCNRILVLRGGRIARELQADELASSVIRRAAISDPSVPTLLGAET
jgi:ribose transport system ATP-binding protein